MTQCANTTQRRACRTPHATALALAVPPDDAAHTRMELARRYPTYGPFGLHDAAEWIPGQTAREPFGLNHLLLFLAVTTPLTDDDVSPLFTANPRAKETLALPAETRLLE